MDDKNGEASANNDVNEIDQEMMSSVATRLGTTLPAAKTEVKETPDEDTETTAEETAGEETTTEGDTKAEGETETDAETTAEGEAEAEETPADEKKSGAEYAKDTKALLAKSLKDLPPETRKQVEGVIGARIGQIVAKERTERDRMGARVEELTAENEQLAAEKGPRYVSTDVHPTLLADSEAELTTRKATLDTWLDWAEDNAGGVNLPDSEGHDESKPTYTKDQIRVKAREWRKERDELIPQVRENLRARAQGDAVLKEAYPALFDAKSAEYAQARKFLKLMPQLKRYANAHAIAAAFVLGQAKLEELIAAKAKPAGEKEKAKKPNSETVIRKAAPRAPGGGSQAKGSVVTRERDKPATSAAVNKVYQDPSNRRNFQDAVGAAIADL